jgi:tetratricopeptide (TPR) repeat protein
MMSLRKTFTARFSSALLLPCLALLVIACNSEILERQAEQLRQQEIEIARQRKELEALIAGKQVQLSTNREQTIDLYNQGLAICPDDDVAHNELGRALADAGRAAEAEKEFETALRINPDFADARRQLENVHKNR